MFDLFIILRNSKSILRYNIEKFVTVFIESVMANQKSHYSKYNVGFRILKEKI